MANVVVVNDVAAAVMIPHEERDEAVSVTGVLILLMSLGLLREGLLGNLFFRKGWRVVLAFLSQLTWLFHVLRTHMG